MNTLHSLLANAILALHFIIGGIILFGWMFPEIRVQYLMLLIGWPVCWLIVGYCPLSKWEFQLRNKYVQGVDLNGEIISHYMKKLFNIDVPKRDVFNFGLMFFLVSFVLNIAYGL